MTDPRSHQWPLWEVFTQPPGGEPHQHAGSVHAPDAEMALQNARDTYARRGEAVSIWVVPSSALKTRGAPWPRRGEAVSIGVFPTPATTASTREDAGPFFAPGNEKPYRH